jgi:hypothetical protein
VAAQCRMGHRLGAAFEAVRPDAGRLTANSRPGNLCLIRRHDPIRVPALTSRMARAGVRGQAGITSDNIQLSEPNSLEIVGRSSALFRWRTLSCWVASLVRFGCRADASIASMFNADAADLICRKNCSPYGAVSEL